MGYLLRSYLKGLADGMNISSDTSEGRLLRNKRYWTTLHDC